MLYVHFEQASKSSIWVTLAMLQPSIVASEAQQEWLTAIAVFHGSVFILTAYFDHFHCIQQVIQRIGSVPKLVLPPHAGHHRQEGKLIHVRAFSDQESGVPGCEPEAPPPKKPSSVQSTSSIVSFRQVATSCSNSL